MDGFSSYTFGEALTAIGQFVSFSCAPDEKENIKDFIRKHLRTVELPRPAQTNVAHGGYGRYSRYEIKQHKYAGGHGGYNEVLEIKDPPDERKGIVLYEYSTNRGVSSFTEWESLHDALKAFQRFWGSGRTNEEFPKLKGFIRRVECSVLTPWFYAVGNEMLVKDFAIPIGIQDDPVFKFGERFLVTTDDAVAIKTCMGSRFYTDAGYHGDGWRAAQPERRLRLIYWDDGTVWEGDANQNPPARPLGENELWIAEAIQQFKDMLMGKNTGFVIDFTNGGKFIGKLDAESKAKYSPDGDYLVSAVIKGRKKPMEGWVYDFHCTPESPNIVEHVIQGIKAKGEVVERIKIKKFKGKKNGKRWLGVFLKPPS